MKKINPITKTTLELGPIIAFFAAYFMVKDQRFMVAGTEYDGFILVTAAFVPLMIVTTIVMWKLTGKLSPMQLVTLVLVVVFGGLTVWLNDERFIKMKPTLLYLIFAGLLGVGLLRGQSYLKLVLAEAMPLTHDGWMILTKRLCLFFLGLAVANEAIWRTMSTETWVTFKTFGLSAAIFAFFMTQGKLFRDHGIEDAKGE